MAFLEKFSEDDRMLIITLPYRVGLWVSAQDETGGIQSNFAEKIAMHEIIEKKSMQETGMFGSAFVHEVMSDLYMRRAEWATWEIKEQTLLDDTMQMIKLISGTLSPKDAQEYAQSALRIGRHVALAYREFDHKASFGEYMGARFRIAIDKVISLFTKQQYESDKLLNISIEEDRALTQLSETIDKGLHAVGIV